MRPQANFSRSTIESILTRLQKVRGRDDRFTASCPAHEDRSPSLSIGIANGRILLHCFAGCPTEKIVAALGLTLNDLFPRDRATTEASSLSENFSRETAEAVWRLGLERARCDDPKILREDREVYRYLETRHLSQAWELAAFGILHEDCKLPSVLAHWPTRSYRIIAPLFDSHGSIGCVQGRAIASHTKPKVLFPRGSRVAGLCFATDEGRQVLSGDASHPMLMMAEGLTDFFALAICSPVPVIGTPGTTNAPSLVGPWVSGKMIFVALDQDDSGESSAVTTGERIRQQGGRPIRVRWPRQATDACEALDRLGLDDFMRFLTVQVKRFKND